MIYGIPNNKSLQGYTKYLNFKSFDKSYIKSFVLPTFDTKLVKFKYLNYTLNTLLKFYRLILLKIFFKNYKILENNYFTNEEIKELSIERKNFDLVKSEKYFLEKYKLNPEQNFTFIKIYKEKKLDGVYVIKKDLLNKKLLIIDSLTKKNFTMPVVLKLNTRYNYSVSFWEGNKILKFYFLIL